MVQAGGVVVVTGASGYIGSHACVALASKGYRVRGVVRDKDAPDNQFLAAACKAAGAMHPLELFSADVASPGALDAAVAGAAAVVHTAQVVKFGLPDPVDQMIKPAVAGVENVLAACEKEAGVEAFIHISSIAAVMHAKEEPKGGVYDEQCHNGFATPDLDPYSTSKVLGEEAVWAHATAKRLQTFRTVVIAPGACIGPVLHKRHGGSSPQVIQQLMAGKFPVAPDMGLALTAVADVAAACVAAVERPAARGRYLICGGTSFPFVEVARMLTSAAPGYKYPTTKAPRWLMLAVAAFDKRISAKMLRLRWSRHWPSFCNTRAQSDLEVDCDAHDWPALLGETARSLVEVGLVGEQDRAGGGLVRAGAGVYAAAAAAVGAGVAVAAVLAGRKGTP